jgi:transporter family protein
MDARALLFVLLSVVGYGLWGFLGKLGSQAMGKYQYLLASYIVATLTFAGAFWVWSPGKIAWAPGALLVVAGGLCTSLGAIGFFSAIERAPLALVAPLTSLYPVLTVLLSLLFLGERLTLAQSLGVVCAILSGVLLSR